MEGVVTRFRKHGYGTIETKDGKKFFFRALNVREDLVVDRRVIFDVGAPARNGKDAEAVHVRLADGKELPTYQQRTQRTSADARAQAHPDDAHNDADVVLVPVLLRGEVVGTIQTFNEERGFGFARLDTGENALVNVLQGPLGNTRYPREGEKIILVTEVRPKGLRAKEWRFYE